MFWPSPIKGFQPWEKHLSTRIYPEIGNTDKYSRKVLSLKLIHRMKAVARKYRYPDTLGKRDEQ